MSVNKNIPSQFKLVITNRVLLTVAMVSLALLSYAQTTISPMLFSANANDTSFVSSAGATYTVSWSLGEIAIETIENETGTQQFIITQGYHQPIYGMPLNAENEWNDDKDWAVIAVYPNPSPGEVQIAISQAQNTEVEMQVYSLQGQLMLRKYYAGEEIKDRINLSHYRTGTYLLMFSKPGEVVTPKTFKLIKTH